MAYHAHRPGDPKSPVPSDGYVMRRIHRDLSRRFATPLFPGSVQDWPLEQVLQSYFEDLYEQLAERTDPEGAQEWQSEMERIAETPEETVKRESDELEYARGNDQAMVQLQKEVDEQLKLYGPLKMPAKGGAGGMGEMAREAQREVASWAGAEEPRGISMKFPR